MTSSHTCRILSNGGFTYKKVPIDSLISKTLTSNFQPPPLSETLVQHATLISAGLDAVNPTKLAVLSEINDDLRTVTQFDFNKPDEKVCSTSIIVAFHDMYTLESPPKLP